MGDGSIARAFAPWSTSESRRPNFHRRGSLPRQDRDPLARSSGTLRVVEDRVQPVFELIIEDHARGEALIADTGYDSDAIRNQVKSKRMKPVIHAKSLS